MILPLPRTLRTVVKSTAGLVILAILTGINGCMFYPVSESEVIGTYQAVPMGNVQSPGLPDGGTEVLELKPDGTCEQDITLKDGRKFSAKGTWEYCPPPREHIIIKGIYVVVDMDDKIAPNIEATINYDQSLSIGRDLAGRIILGSTEYTHYEKK